MARRRDRRGPGRQPPGRPGRGMPRKGSFLEGAVKRAIGEEIKGVPPAEILLHLRSVGLDAETARTIYSHVREQVANTRRRVMWGMLLGGAALLAVGLGWLTLMGIRWTQAGYGWWIVAGVLAVIGLVLLLIGQTRLRRLPAPRDETGGKERGAG